MHPASPSPRRRWSWRDAVGPGLALAAVALLLIDREEESDDVLANRPESPAAEIVGVDTGDQGRAPARPNPAPPAQKKPQFIVGQPTQDIKDANAELKSGQARQASTRTVAKGPITLTGNAYVAIIGQTSMMQIQHAVDLYHAQNDRYPRDLDEFMNEIIKPNGIALPTLPRYQKYSYDANQHKLIIIEYPDRK